MSLSFFFGQITSNDNKKISVQVHCKDTDERDAWINQIKTSVLGLVSTVGKKMPHHFS